jgi:hypothetical protein
MIYGDESKHDDANIKMWEKQNAIMTSQKGYEQLSALRAEVTGSIETIMQSRREITWEKDRWQTDLSEEVFINGIRRTDSGDTRLVIDKEEVGLWDGNLTITDLLLVLQTIETHA